MVNRIDVAQLEGPPGLQSDVSPKQRAVLRLCNIGRGEPSKRQDLAIRVWHALHDLTPSQLLLIGSLSDAATEALDSLPASVREDVIVRGYIPQAGRLLSDVSVTLATSSREGLPGVVLESLALGTPVVCSDIPGNAWIASQVSGVILVPVNASVNVWVAAIMAGIAEDRGSIRRSFAQSVFASDNVLESYRVAWTA
ncbi:glycosyltransferase family 4 protein [Ornithinimicrobium sp. LYQ121]|uniref:glycosyltransferase family 4 protein n=1 Tax=Ornithinimicrobium sp. LYQ121 TaxID=3378801 RepID=UPI0038548366